MHAHLRPRSTILCICGYHKEMYICFGLQLVCFWPKFSTSSVDVYVNTVQSKREGIICDCQLHLRYSWFKSCYTLQRSSCNRLDPPLISAVLANWWFTLSYVHKFLTSGLELHKVDAEL